VNATTHTEIYRRFKGELKPARPAFKPLYDARLHAAQKRRLPLLLLMVPPWISGIVYSFLAYTKFTVESGGVVTGMGPAAAIGGAFMGSLIEVHRLIVSFTTVSRFFALLAIAWYGAGLICEDRRAGAHLLYFSRPLTRIDYFLAHFATACTFGAFTVVGPAFLICLVAVFSSPEYSFLTEKWDVILGALAYAMIYVAVTSLIVLGVSSISSRKTYALAGIFGVFLSTLAVGRVASRLQHDSDFGLFSIPDNFRRLADWMLSTSESRTPFEVMQRVAEQRWDWNPWYSVAVLGGISIVSLLLVASRLRRMEVVG
jgi:ABC-type transport system involved in multi-copper enzyme maturation permease subunit